MRWLVRANIFFLIAAVFLAPAGEFVAAAEIPPIMPAPKYWFASAPAQAMHVVCLAAVLYAGAVFLLVSSID
jgi:hypothetical protein